MDQKVKHDLRRAQQYALIKKRRDERRNAGLKPYQFWLTPEQAERVKQFVEKMK